MDIPMSKNALIQIEEITNFFCKSPLATDILKGAVKVYILDVQRTHLINYCSTQFIERHDASSVFLKLFLRVCISLEEIAKDTKRKISGKADAFLAAVENSEFLIFIVVCDSLLSLTLPLSINL